jgi:hypothetical protein
VSFTNSAAVQEVFIATLKEELTSGKQQYRSGSGSGSGSGSSSSDLKQYAQYYKAQLDAPLQEIVNEPEADIC